eukprot:7897720-Pyramimonas_sp.AAC.1
MELCPVVLRFASSTSVDRRRQASTSVAPQPARRRYQTTLRCSVRADGARHALAPAPAPCQHTLQESTVQ